jgi:histone-lysine N-methyltransferase SETMAR
MPYSIVLRAIRKISGIPSEERSQDFGGRVPNLDYDARILSALEREPNTSLWEIAHETRIPKSTVFDILRERLKYSAINDGFVPHTLTEGQRRERVDKSTALLSLLAKAKRCAWQFTITDDESWFFYYTSHSKIWLPADADTPEVAKHLINIPKIMIPIFWNPFGIQVLVALPEKISFDAEYFINYVLTPIEELPVMRAAVTQKQILVIHMDNSPIHKSKAAIQKIASLRLKIAIHPAYSPDLAPSDFFFPDISSKRSPIVNLYLQMACSRHLATFQDPSLKAYLTNG